MANEVHKGHEHKNIAQTWEQNEQERRRTGQGDANDTPEPVPAASELDRMVREGAEEYDAETKEPLPGERASVADDSEEG